MVQLGCLSLAASEVRDQRSKVRASGRPLETDPPLRRQMERASTSGPGCVCGQAAVWKCGVLFVHTLSLTKSCSRRGQGSLQRKARDRGVMEEQETPRRDEGFRQRWEGGRGKERQIAELEVQPAHFPHHEFKAQRRSTPSLRTHRKSSVKEPRHWARRHFLAFC